MDLAPLRAVLESLDSEVAQAEAERVEAEEVLRRCEQRVQTLQTERSGIESFIRRHEGFGTFVGSHSADPGNASDESRAPIPRTEAVAEVLAEAEGAMAPADIQRRLHDAGRDDTYRDVAAALSHLKSRGRATNVARGLWALTEAAGPDLDYEPPEPDDADYEPPSDSRHAYWEEEPPEEDAESDEEYVYQ